VTTKSRMTKLRTTFVLSMVLLMSFAAMSAMGSFAQSVSNKVVAALTSETAAQSTAKVPTTTTARDIPVLVYHEMNNGCNSAATICNASDPESVSATQFTAEMSYMAAQGYHTVSLAQYEAWLAKPSTQLPAKPFLITVDNGIGDFLTGAQSTLAHYGFTATAFLVTGFAHAAAGNCAPLLTVAGISYHVQPGCPADNTGWDLTWSQLASLSSSVYSFALEAGASGHYVQTYDGTACQMFYACMIPGETASAYETRVVNELNTGESELAAKLPGRVNSTAWVVPYSDLGYQPCTQSDCTPQSSNGPTGWLSASAGSRFTAVFVEDAFRNGTQNDRFRDDIKGRMTLSDFTSQLQSFVTAGSFNH